VSKRPSRGVSPDGSPWLLLSEAASLLGVSRERLWQLLREKRLGGLYSPYEGRYLLPESACLAFVREHSGPIAAQGGARVNPNPWGGQAPAPRPTAPPGPRASA